MNVYTIRGFTGHWPVGTSAVVVAEDRDAAKSTLEAELARIGLSQEIRRDDFEIVCPLIQSAIILNDGEY